MATPPAPPKSNTRRDALLKLEAQVQQQWETEGTFEADAEQGKPKFFVTFPQRPASTTQIKREARDDAREDRERPAVVPGPASTRNEPAREPAVADARGSHSLNAV